ncbi:unnamed protein product [Clonostachys chloroleuca]|uniref:Uncharacterized protein n=1 Tax=Clonostachys chloroleuca TaxID=1926264 RepID=A0AA35VQX0_9HYPO|nr:unnamed protein product [Clonostachys chloroleuca]
MAFMKKGFPAQMLFITLVVCFVGSATADLASWDDVLDVRGIEDIDYDTFDLQRRDEEESYLEVRGGNTPPVSPLTSTPPGSPRPVSPLSRHSSTKSNDRKDAGSGSKSGGGGLHRSNAVRRKKNTKRSNTPPVSPLTSTPPGSPRPVSPLSRHSSTKSNDRKDAGSGSKSGGGGLHRSNAVRRKKNTKRSNTPPVSPLTSTPPGSPRPVSPLSRHSSTKSNDRKDAGSGSKSGGGGLHRSNAVRRKKNTKRSNTPPVSPLTSTPPGSPRPVSPLSRHSSTKSNDRKDAGGSGAKSGGLHRSNAIRRKGPKTSKRSF